MRIVGNGVLAHVTRWWMCGLFCTVVFDGVSDAMIAVGVGVVDHTLVDMASTTLVDVASTTLYGGT